MARVAFTPHLRRYFPELTDQEVPAASVRELIDALERRFPGLGGYLVDDRGSLRRHVNIFIGATLLTDRTHLSDPLAADDEVYVMQALSGG